jgi:hypothetical protein
MEIFETQLLFICSAQFLWVPFLSRQVQKLVKFSKLLCLLTSQLTFFKEATFDWILFGMQGDQMSLGENRPK